MPHIHENYDFVVTFFIVFQGKVLLVNHPRYGVWIAPGGHIELDEDPEQALYREIEEETGLKVQILSDKPELNTSSIKAILKPNYVDVHEANPPHKHIALIYFGRSQSPDYRLSDEHTDMKWFTPEELDDEKYALTMAAKFYCREAIKSSRE